MKHTNILTNIVMTLIMVIIAATIFMIVRSIVMTGVHPFTIFRYFIVGAGGIFILVFWVAAAKNIADKRKSEKDEDDY